MAVNRRYLSSPWRQVSSLYRAAQSAKNLKDEEMKFKWDFEQISNEDYLKYAEGRLKEQTDPSDQMKWMRNVRTVQREVRSDQRAMDFLKISQMDGNTSAKAYSRYEAYVKLANAAAEDGDNDAFIAAQTAANNAFEAYSNKVDSEGRGSASKARTALREDLRDIENAIQDKEEWIRTNKDALSPGQLAYELTQLNKSKSQYNELYAQGLAEIDPDDYRVYDKQQLAEKYKNKSIKESMVLDGKRDEKTGELIGDPIVEIDNLGRQSFRPAKGVMKQYDANGQEQWYDTKSGKAVSYSQGPDGEYSLSEIPFTQASGDYYTDPVTGVQYKINTPVNTDNQYAIPRSMTDKDIAQRNKDIESGKIRDVRFLNKVTEIGGNPVNLRFALNEGRPIADTAEMQALINKGYISDAQYRFAKNAGMIKGDTNVDKLDQTKIPQFNYETGTFEPAKGDGRPLAIPEGMKPLFRGMSTFEDRQRLEETTGLGMERPGLSVSNSRAMTPEFNKTFFGNKLGGRINTAMPKKAAITQQDKTNAKIMNTMPKIVAKPVIALSKTNTGKEIFKNTSTMLNDYKKNPFKSALKYSNPINSIKANPITSLYKGAIRYGANKIKGLFKKLF